MTLLFASFFAGILTVAAPCILPLLPVIVGGSTLGADKKSRPLKPYVIAASLGASVVVFSLLLRASTALLGVPQTFWSIVSGGIVLLFGLSILFPVVWEKLVIATGLYGVTNKLSGKAAQKNGYLGDVLLGASLGPIFNSCSPTYALIIAIVLPKSLAEGLVYLVLYAAGLASTLLLIGLLGRRITTKLNVIADPKSLIRKLIGVIFIVVGLAVATGLDKKFQTFVLDRGWYGPVERLEQRFMINN